MIPIRDEIKSKRTPYITTLLIGINVAVFLLQYLAGPRMDALIYEFAMIPAELSSGLDLGDVRDIFTSMFMHAGLMHLLGNMLYLWIFGDNVEDSLGHAGFLVFYLVGGAIAALAHVVVNPTSIIPTVGASGAIAAILGAYLVMYPRSRVYTFIPIGYLMRLTLLPASLVLGVWFVLQLFSGVISVGMPDLGGTAFWAHIGGFVFGILAGFIFKDRRTPQTPQHWS